MSKFNARVTVRRGDLYVQLDHGLTGAGHPHLFLRASSSAAPALADTDPWPIGLAWSVIDRLRNGGDEKGRVLGIWQELPGHEPVPLAALAWHTQDTGPLYVLDAGCSNLVDAPRGRQLTSILLAALLEVAEHPSAGVPSEWRSRLRWSQVAIKRAEVDDYRRENLLRAGSLGFSKYRPPPPVAHWTRAAWLGERVF